MTGRRSAVIGVASAQPPFGGRAENGRMSAPSLLFLAAGGVIGSGWLFAGASADSEAAGWWAVGSWLIGGLLMLVVTAVMVEVSTKAPKTGGLIFLPLQTSGPLLATVVAAGVWVFYAANPASESAATVQNLAAWIHLPFLFTYAKSDCATGRPTGWGIVLAMLFLVLITIVNLLGPRRFLIVNNVLTAIKIFAPVLIVVLLICALTWSPAKPVAFPLSPQCPVPRTGGGLRSMLSAAVGSGVLYSYLGFQGPLDFAGNVRRGGIGEAARLRLAVYGTVLGSMLLYAALQCVIIYLRYDHHSTGNVDYAPSVYATFAGAVVGHGWLGSTVSWFIHLDSVLSPAGTAMVFTFVMTREVAALSRAHLTHRGLQRSKYSVKRLPEGFLRRMVGDDRLELYWRILIVDFLISLAAFVVTIDHWSVLQNFPTIMALLVYATPSVVLASLHKHVPGRFPPRWRWWYALMARVSFATLAVTFVLFTGDVQWGMVALAVGCLLLFGLPAVLLTNPRYDARVHWPEFGDLLANTTARLAAVLGVYFAFLTAAWAIKRAWPAGLAWDVAGLAVVVLVSLSALHLLVRWSASYMADPGNPPLLPEPLPSPPGRRPATGTGS
jgi:amino acid transporter